jgi:hypothetical protein
MLMIKLDESKLTMTMPERTKILTDGSSSSVCYEENLLTRWQVNQLEVRTCTNQLGFSLNTHIRYENMFSLLTNEKAIQNVGYNTK